MLKYCESRGIDWLDNLKLGYGGTKEELNRLLKDAEKLTGKKFDVSNFSDIIEAIHAVQENLGITGTTAEEAEKTISGSLASMKSAWGNLLPALIQGGDSFDQCVNNLVDSVGIFAENVKPAILKALSGLGDLIEKLAPIIEDEFPKLVDELLPPLIKAATSLLKGLIKALPGIVKTIAGEIPNILKQVGEGIAEAFGGQFSVIGQFGSYLAENAKSIGAIVAKLIPVLLGLVGAFKAVKFITSIFGKSSGSGGFFGNITNIFKKLAQTKTATILKGMANLAIIVGGFTILTAACVGIMTLVSKITDFKTMLQMVGIIGALGVVATALAKFAGIVGEIPIMTVTKGLANMAIIIGGMSALFLLIGAVSLIDFDLAKITKITLIIGALGTVGAVLSGFAGIVGMIPIPIVLTGLANMALVLGGVSALIVAFGALSEIKGFNEFITKGGETLSNIFNVIGKMAGSLVGGLGEGISNSLPQIGKNLSAFVTSIKPMFTMFSGVDMSGVGSFFSALGGFMLQMAGEKLLSFFTGGTNFAELGTQLNTFAEKTQGFFNTVSTFPENGFVNATKLFDCLAGIKNLPKEGGIVGWFSGGINFTNLSTGLGELASTSVVTFFNTIKDIEQAGFDNATKLFDCLAGMKSLPREGGIKGWFNGDIKYGTIAEGLSALSEKGVQNFFNMVGGLDQKAFDNTKALFKSLSTIGDLPETGGWWDKIKGDETTTLGKIAEDLGAFSEKASVFFADVNNLNISNLNGLWESLKNSKTVTANVSKIVDENISDIVDKISKLPKKMGDGLKSKGESLSSALVSIWKDAVNASKRPVNKLIDGANWILEQFGSDKRVASWEPYAKGTDGHKGGNALVNDGRGAELVQMPNGNTFIPKGKNVFIPNAPKGMKVLPAERTAQLMGKKSPTFRYANGVGDIDIWSYMDNSKGLIDSVSKKYVNYDGLTGLALNIGKGMVNTIKGQMSSWAKKLYDEFGALSLAAYNPSKGVEQWRSTVIRALQMEGQYSEANVARTLFQMQTESGGNPRAINLWDSNAKAGIPSKGLMQVIDPTFRAYARPGFDKNIYDPLSNILASIRYAVSRYGSLAKAYRGVGYANGGLVTQPGWIGEESEPEMVIPLSKNKRNRALNLWKQTGNMLGYTPENSGYQVNTVQEENNTYSPTFNITINGSLTDRETVKETKKQVYAMLDEYFNNLARRNKVIRQV